MNVRTLRTLEVFIGWDSREEAACRVAERTLWQRSTLMPRWLRLDRLVASGLFWRLSDRRGGVYDLISNAPNSTDFAISRFLVPILCHSGWALFTDADVVFMRDVHQLLELADDRYAVMVVKHQHKPSTTEKMDGRVQLPYARKNWSSVMLWNCSHPANLRLTLHDVNTRTGLALHQLYWLNDSEIGELPREWNWLVGEQEKPDDIAIAHFTLGCPALEGWVPREHDEIWLQAAGRL